MDPDGEYLKNLHHINRIFDELTDENANNSIFDIRKCPYYIPDVRGNGIFLEDAVHYTPEANRWVAEEIVKGINITIAEL